MSTLNEFSCEREVLYSKADVQVDTSGPNFEESLEALIPALTDTRIQQSLAAVVISG